MRDRKQPQWPRRYRKPLAQRLTDWAFGLIPLLATAVLLTSCAMRVVEGQEPTIAPPPEIHIDPRYPEVPQKSTPHSVLVAGTFDALAAPGMFAVAGEGAPPRGWSLPVTVVEVYDGDTVTVELRMRARVRLLDCWAPELRDAGGERSKRRLEKLALGKEGVLYVSRAGDGRLDKHFTFGRLLGRIWIGEDVSDLSSQMVEGGFATKEKPKEPR